MRKISCRFKLVFLCLAAICVLSAECFAEESHDRTQVGRTITVGAQENVSDATCFGCGIRVRGHVSGDVTSFGGSIVLEEGADVAGDATSFGGDVRLDKNVTIGGGVTVFGGHLRRDPAASIGGDVSDFGGSIWIALIFVLPFLVLGAFIAVIIWIIRRLAGRSMPASA